MVAEHVLETISVNNNKYKASIWLALLNPSSFNLSAFVTDFLLYHKRDLGQSLTTVRL